MTIIAAIVGVIGAIGLLIYRFGIAAQEARDVADAATDVMNAARRSSFRRKAIKNPLSELDDPREGVAAILVALFRDDGDLGQNEIQFLETLIRERLEFEPADELVAHARWLTQDVPEPGNVVQRVSRYLNQSCSQEQKLEILELARQVAAYNGEPSGIQMQAIQQLRNNIGLEVARPGSH